MSLTPAANTFCGSRTFAFPNLVHTSTDLRPPNKACDTCHVLSPLFPRQQEATPQLGARQDWFLLNTIASAK
eukprot:1149970-Pelagomonas_calceolata.AAC.1